MYKVGDKVRPIGNPRDLPDHDDIGNFNYSDWDREFTISQIYDNTGFLKLKEDDTDIGWWWHPKWLVPSKKIRVGGE